MARMRFLTILLFPICFFRLVSIDYIEFARQSIFTNGRILSVFFVPDDKVKNILLGLINNEKKYIFTAQYRLNDKDVVQALIEAHKRGVRLYIIVDSSALEDRFHKVKIVHAEGIPVHVYTGYTIMHNKFFIFGQNFEHKAITWTGSANVTYAGLARNQENVFITESQFVIEKYKNKFTTLWNQTTPFQEIKMPVIINPEYKMAI
ncbi:MAG: phospholipase D-like domain-containing protein [Candidatus Babeliales bacterium]